jgi:hypothetical protein
VNIEQVLSGSTIVGFVLILTVLALARANRSFLRDVASDPDRTWRGLTRLAAVLTMVMLVWIALFDQWRQLIDEPLRRAGQFPSERIILDPVSPSIRTISFVLLVASLLTVAPLIARHVGGYATQAAGCICAFAMCIPLYALRVRFDLGLALGFAGDPQSPGDVVGYVVYILITWALLIAVILLAYSALALATAIPVTLLLDLIGRREPTPTSEADDFFSSFRERITSTDEK